MSTAVAEAAPRWPGGVGSECEWAATSNKQSVSIGRGEAPAQIDVRRDQCREPEYVRGKVEDVDNDVGDVTSPRT